MAERDVVTEEILADPGTVAGLRSLGLGHDNLRPLIEAYVQFLVHAPRARLAPGVAVRAVWRAHRASPDFERFAQAHPSFALTPPPRVFDVFVPSDYSALFAQVGIAEDHIDDALWPPALPPRALGLTDRQALMMYAGTLLLSLWLIARVIWDEATWQSLFLIPLLGGYAIARLLQGQARETEIALTPRHYERALSEARSAWPLATYERGARRRRAIIRGRWSPRAL